MIVYGVYAMTEGRSGPALQRLYRSEARAWGYANQQPGIMGRSATQFHAGRCSAAGEPVGDCPGWNCERCWKMPWGWSGDWRVEPLEVY